MTTTTLSFSQDPLWGALLRFIINTTVLFIIIRLIYFRFKSKESNIFSFFLMGIMIFTICILLKNVEITMGIALGLFAIFSVIRFRTKNFPVKDMSYLFAVMGISAINAMFNFPHPVRGTILVNLILILTILLLELLLNKKDTKKEKKVETTIRPDQSMNSYQLIYDKLLLLAPEKMDELIADISRRTNINIEKLRICKIDLIQGYAELEVFFNEKPSGKTVENPEAPA